MKGRWKHPMAGMGCYGQAKRDFPAPPHTYRPHPGPGENPGVEPSWSYHFETEPRKEIIVADSSASKEVDAIIDQSDDWRGEKLAQLRAVVLTSHPAVVEEVKWKKPSRPEGVPVWSHDGIICTGEMLKSAVRLTFPKGAEIKDPRGLFNTRLDSKTVRAIDIREGEAVNDDALTALVREAMRLNESRLRKR
jgi:hypothetical protein